MKTMKNKLFVLALLIPMVLSGCGSQKESSSSVSEPSSFSSETSSTNSSSTNTSSASASSSSSSVQSSSSSAVTTSSEPAPTIPNYVLHGLFSDSLDWADKAMTRNPSSSTEYMIIGVTLNRNDVFKIHMDGDYWYGFSDIKKYAGIPSGLVEQAEDYDNIKVLTSGTYDIYCNKNASDGGNIYLARTDDSGDDPDPTPGVVKVTGVSLNRSGKMLQPRNEFQLTATVSPSNATNQDVTWTSSNKDVATVTTAGRIIANSTTGTTTITVKTADGNKTAQCVIYVKTNGIPDYYLTGTINGSLVSSGTYTRYPAIPLSGGSYLIADVDLQSGDKLNVRGENGKSSLLDRYNHLYEYQVKKAASVNIILSPNDSSYNYLTLKEK